MIAPARMAGSTRGKSIWMNRGAVAGPLFRDIRIPYRGGGWSSLYLLLLILEVNCEKRMYQSDTWSGPIGLRL